MHPGAVLPDICLLIEKWIKPARLNCRAKRRFMHLRRAGGNNHPVEAVFFDVLFNPALRRKRAHVHVFGRVHNVWKRCGIFNYSVHIYNTGDVCSAVTHIHTYPQFLSCHFSSKTIDACIAAAEACVTLSGMSLGDSAQPATNTPGISVDAAST
ncbi:hypothetical protein BMS3Bbin16_00398 [archaeon BMS3Bbin16]|nr:hypothetical protein BMS3Bbin16_00398 [archaeon BMS3Bbin16]